MPLSEDTLFPQPASRPSIYFTLDGPISVVMPIEAFYHEHQVHTPQRTVKYSYASTPFAMSYKVTILSAAPEVNWRARIPELTCSDPRFDDGNYLSYKEAIDPSRVRTPWDDESSAALSAASSARQFDSHAPTTTQCPPMSHGKSQPVSGSAEYQTQETANGSSSNEQRDRKHPGEDAGYKVPETCPSGPTPQLVERRFEEEVIGHNWIKLGAGDKTRASLNDNSAQATTGLGHNARRVSRMAALRSKLRYT